MRFVWAVVAFVLATVMIGAGIAQRTVLRGPETVAATVQVPGDAPFVLLEGAVLASHPGAQRLDVRGDGTVFAAYGRTADLEAWLTRSEYTRVGVDADGGIATTDVPASQASEDPAAASLSPIGSDLWLEELQQEGQLVTSLQLPEGMSVLLASDGAQPAPAQVDITWPVTSNTPWAGPLIAVGAALLGIGIVLYFLAWRHLRRSRGPRRKGLPLAATQPIDLAVDDPDKGVIAAAPVRRRLTRGRQAFAALPIVLTVGLVATGCSADAWPQLAPSATPSPTATVLDAENQATPAVTREQAERILTRIAEDVSTADASGDAALAETRLTGAALAERQTNYSIRASIADYAPLPPIPAQPLAILLPEAFDQWPRTFFAVIDADAGAAAPSAAPTDGAATDAAAAPADPNADTTDTIMAVTQADPWSPYKVSYSAELATDSFPELAPWYLGATQVPPDSPFLVLRPDQLATAYADVLTNGSSSAYAALFEAEGDAFRTGVEANREQRRTQFNETGAETGTISFSTAAGAYPAVALQTLESGAIVAVSITEDDTVTPTNEDAVIRADAATNPVVTSLTGQTQSATGFTTTYSDQLFFFVPAAGSTEPIQFLGYSSNPLTAKVIE